MAFKFSVQFVLILFCIVILTSSTPAHGVGLIDNVTQVLFNAGYTSMSLALASSLPTLLARVDLNTTAVTIFCPTDFAFVDQDYFVLPAQPPLWLVEYHVVPRKVEKEDLESSAICPIESKLDTLLNGHSLVITTSRYMATSLNKVKIKEWDLYNDGRVIVHGIEKFLNPDYMIEEFYWQFLFILSLAFVIILSMVLCHKVLPIVAPFMSRMIRSLRESASSDIKEWLLYHYYNYRAARKTAIILISSTPAHGVGLLNNVTQVLSNAGYVSMSLALNSTFPLLLPRLDLNKTAVTIFCPSDLAFARQYEFSTPCRDRNCHRGDNARSAPQLQLPLWLLEYHTVPREVEKEDLKPSSILPTGSKLNTLLRSRTLVITTSWHVPSINEVKIKEWNVYNDGHVIVHGVDGFFATSYNIFADYYVLRFAYLFIIVVVLVSLFLLLFTLLLTITSRIRLPRVGQMPQV
ncbi:hypothetical protein Syun_025066 [Stephania yunnanensis]|uniref:FAS1 domain-containing protein n=1 Tax=Stephania yunnanensis TaxID=152371 RepID=A0AAP0ERF2_9MAGN